MVKIALIHFGTRTQSILESIFAKGYHIMKNPRHVDHVKAIFHVKVYCLLMVVSRSKNPLLVATILAEIESRLKQFFADAETLTSATDYHAAKLASLHGSGQNKGVISRRDKERGVQG